MPRKAKSPLLVCKYFTWRLFRRDGVYYADGRSGKYNLGKPSLNTRDEDAAINNLHRLDHAKAVELGLAQPEAVRGSRQIGLDEGWDAFLAHRCRAEVLGGIAKSTQERYRNICKKHLVFCAKRGIATWNDVDNRVAEEFGNWLTNDEGHASETVYLELTVLMSVARWLIEQKYLPESSAIRLKLRKPQGSDRCCYSDKQVVAMIKHCRETAGLDWLGDVILALACTGLRIGELVALRWSDICFDSNTIRIADERTSSKKDAKDIRRTKGRRSRTLPIHPQLLELLKRLPRAEDGRVFHATRGRALRQKSVLENLQERVIEPLQDQFPTPEGEIGFKDGCTHGLRHYFCSKCFLDGASEGEIKDWLGHADSRVVARYRHLGSEDSQRKMRSVNFLSHPSDTSSTSESA